MQFHWLNKQNNQKLIIFFAGWSFDYKPFEFLHCEDFDVLMLYDYNNLELPEIPIYEEYFLVSWSMGVFTAYLLKDKLPEFKQKIAVNGTPYPVHNEWGIPEKTFLLTLRHTKTGLEGKFYQNIFLSENEYQKYINSQVERRIDNRAQELKSLYELIKNTDIDYITYYDKAIISDNDKIIPTKNQQNFWNEKVEIKNLASGHFPFYNFNNWNEILLCK